MSLVFMELPLTSNSSCGPPALNDAFGAVAGPVVSGQGVCATEIDGALELFETAKTFRAFGLIAAARRIEQRARRTPLHPKAQV